MGKQGPCHHCGVTSTPLWRNGPPEKPVLCNACGSRWRTKGTLTNYIPLHAREPIDSKEFKFPVVKPKELRLHVHKKKQSNHNIEVKQKYEITESDQSFQKGLEEDASNRSSSVSAISYSESCSHICGNDANDLTGQLQSNVWDSLLPSRKRTCVPRPKLSPIEKLTRDLCSILHQESSYISGSPEDDLLYETETPIGSLEIGHGVVLIRHPNSALAEESEASSLPIDSKLSNVSEAHSGLLTLPLDVESKGLSSPVLRDEKVRRKQTSQEHVKRDEASHELFHILRSSDSSPSHIDLKDVINFGGFMKHLTHEERQQLMKYLPSVDTVGPSESLKSMFCSPQFIENLSYFKQLLLEGVFDLSFSYVDMHECKTLRKLVLGSFMKSKWVEHYTNLKDKKNSDTVGRKKVWTVPNLLGSSNIIPFKRPHDIHNQNFEDKKTKIRSPKRSCYRDDTNLCSIKSCHLKSSNFHMRSAINSHEYMENDSSSCSPRSYFTSPPDGSSMLDSLRFSDENSDEGLLLDVHSCSSFPEAELLCDTWKQNAPANSQSAESGINNISFNHTSSSRS